jgi:hypothetical protein
MTDSRENVVLSGVADALTWRHVLELSEVHPRPGKRVILRWPAPKGSISNVTMPARALLRSVLVLWSDGLSVVVPLAKVVTYNHSSLVRTLPALAQRRFSILPALLLGIHLVDES